jgi:hypothetical protein
MDDAAKLKEEVARLTERIERLESPSRLFAGGDSWIDRMSISGDFRYRHDSTRLDPDEGREQVRNYHRIRARVGLLAQVNDEVTFGFRLATGDDNSPITANQTLDNASSKKDIWLDRAYISYKPSALKDYSAEMLAGKMPNPFFRPGGQGLIWDADISPEGIAAKTVFKTPAADGKLEIFVNGGGFWMDENANDADSGLFGVQGGVKFPAGGSGVEVTAGVSGYWFTPCEDQVVFYSPTNARGNSAYLDGANLHYEYEYSLVEVFGEARMKVYGRPLAVFADFVQNSDPGDDESAYLFGFCLGERKVQWDWQVSYNYREVERDAVLGATTDSDFGAGGTDLRGHAIVGGVRLLKNVDLDLTYYLADRRIADGEDSDESSRLLLDLVVKF